VIYHLTRHEIADLPVAAAVASRGKELQAGETVAAARRLFGGGETLVVPVLDGGRYVGSVDHETLGAAASDETPLGTIATDLVPVARADRRAADALEELDRHGGRRLVVVAEDGSTYVGIVCLRSDRLRLCVDAAHLEEHA
jgi:CBS domain-containing protein